jgi:hypothetical protein
MTPTTTDVWVTGNDGTIYHTQRTEGTVSTWSAWSGIAPPVGVTFVGDPTARARSLISTDIVVQDTVGNFWWNYYYNGALQGWKNLGNGSCLFGAHATNPTLNTWSADRMDLWVRCPNGIVAHNYSTSAGIWAGFPNGGTLTTPANAAIVAGPAAVSRSFKTIDVAVQTANGAVLVNSYNENTFTWSGWVSWGTLPNTARSLTVTPKPNDATKLYVWAAPFTVFNGVPVTYDTTLKLATAANAWTTVDVAQNASAPSSMVAVTRGSVVDLVRNYGSYQYEKWSLPPGSQVSGTVDASSAWEAGSAGLVGTDPGCNGSDRNFAAYLSNGTPVIAAFAPTTPSAATFTSISTLPGLLPTDAPQADGAILRSPAGNLILVRSVLRSRENYLFVWKNTSCGALNAWTLVSAIRPSSYFAAWGQPQDGFQFDCRDANNQTCGGWDFPRAAIDKNGFLSITTDADGGSGANRRRDGVVLRSSANLDAVATATFNASIIDPGIKSPSESVTATSSVTYMADCLPADASSKSIPRLRWIRGNANSAVPVTALGVSLSGYQPKGLPVAWDEGTGYFHSAVSATSACLTATTWAQETDVSVTKWASYTSGGVNYDVLRYAYPTLALNGRQVLRVLKVVVGSDDSSQVYNLVTIGNGSGGTTANTSVTQATWVEGDPNQPGGDPSVAMVYWQQNTVGTDCALGSLCVWTTKAALLSGGDLSPPFDLGVASSTSCNVNTPGCLQKPGDFAGAATVTSGSSTTFSPIWIPAGRTLGLRAAAIVQPKLN